MSAAWTMFTEAFLKNSEAASRNSKEDMAFWAWALRATFTLWTTKGWESLEEENTCAWGLLSRILTMLSSLKFTQSEEVMKGNLYGVLVRRFTFVTWSCLDTVWTDDRMSTEGRQGSKDRDPFQKSTEEISRHDQGDEQKRLTCHVDKDCRAVFLLKAGTTTYRLWQHTAGLGLLISARWGDL